MEKEVCQLNNRHTSFFWAGWIHSTSSHSTYLAQSLFNIILSFTLRRPTSYYSIQIFRRQWSVPVCTLYVTIQRQQKISALIQVTKVILSFEIKIFDNEPSQIPSLEKNSRQGLTKWTGGSREKTPMTGTFRLGFTHAFIPFVCFYFPFFIYFILPPITSSHGSFLRLRKAG